MTLASAIGFECEGSPLIGILHRSEQSFRRGVLFVVGGGPQYRAGGHRQLTLWSRFLSARGYPAFRFDYRGMGDSHGSFRGFEDVGQDIRAAVDKFFASVDGLTEIVLWGECDAASAILLYAHRDPRVKGVVLLNPWVHTDAGQAKAVLRFYYLNRVMQPSFWRKVVGLKFNPLASISSVLRLWRQSRATAVPVHAPGRRLDAEIPGDLALPDRLLMGLQRFKGPVLLVLSGRDLIAREFETVVNGSPAWQEQLRLKPVSRHDVPDGDHTFSSAAQRAEVANLGLDWLRGW